MSHDRPAGPEPGPKRVETLTTSHAGVRKIPGASSSIKCAFGAVALNPKSPFWCHFKQKVLPDQTRLHHLLACFTNFFLLRELGAGNDLPPLNEGFIRRLTTAMTLTGTTYGEVGIGPARAEFRDLFPDKFELATNKHSNLLINTLARAYFVNFANDLILNFISRLLRYLICKYNLHGFPDARTLLNDAFEAKARTPQLDSLRSWLDHDPRKAKNLKQNLTHFTRLQYAILKEMEGLPNTAAYKRLFSLAPVASGYCATSVLLNPSTCFNVIQQLADEDRRIMLKEIFTQATGISFEAYQAGAASAKDKIAVTAAEIKLLVERVKHPKALLCSGLFSNAPMREALFGVLFDYKKLQRDNYRFVFSVSSNGVTASLLFERRKPAKENGANGAGEAMDKGEVVDDEEAMDDEGNVEEEEMEMDDEEAVDEMDEEDARAAVASKDAGDAVASKDARDAEEMDDVHYSRFVAIDPGFVNLGVAALQEEGDKEPTIHTISSKEYQRRAGHMASKKRHEFNKRDSPIYRCVCQNTPTMKTADLGKMAEAIEFRLKHFQFMYRFCIEQKFLKHQCTTWIRTQRALTWISRTFAGEEPDSFTSSRAEHEAALRTARMRKEQAQSHPKHTRHSNPARKTRRKEKRRAKHKEKREEKRKERKERGATLVGIGDWALKGNTNSIIRGHQHVPHQGIRKALLQRPGVVVWDIDGSYTSKRCYQCQSVDGEMHEAVLKKRRSPATNICAA